MRAPRLPEDEQRRARAVELHVGFALEPLLDLPVPRRPLADDLELAAERARPAGGARAGVFLVEGGQLAVRLGDVAGGDQAVDLAVQRQRLLTAGVRGRRCRGRRRAGPRSGRCGRLQPTLERLDAFRQLADLLLQLLVGLGGGAGTQHPRHHQQDGDRYLHTSSHQGQGVPLGRACRL